MSMKGSGETRYFRGQSARFAPRLSAEEEQQLATEVQCGNHAATEALIRANFGLVLAIARKYRGLGLDVVDLVGEGNLGLVRAAMTYKPRTGARFGSYAWIVIRRCIISALHQQSRTIRIPTSADFDHKKFYRLKAEGVDIALSDAQAARLWKIEQCKYVKRLLTGGKGDPKDRSLYPASKIPAPEPVERPFWDDDQNREVVELAMCRLNLTQRAVIAFHFGFDGKPRPLRRVAKILGLTTERIRQIKFKALCKMSDELRFGKCARLARECA